MLNCQFPFEVCKLNIFIVLSVELDASLPSCKRIKADTVFCVLIL